jgi:protein transport protein SEC61 subunit alpha
MLTSTRIIYGYFEIAAKEGDLSGMKGMVMG